MLKIKKALKTIFSVLLFLSATSTVSATSVLYDVANISGSLWEYSYSIVNDTLSSPIEEFTIFFDYGLYDNLAVTSSSADWDEIALNPDLIFGFPEDGLYDAFALGSGIGIGATTSGFSVSFDWLGVGTPGSQYFEIVDPLNFSVLDSGFTNLNSTVTSVPEPSVGLLMTGPLILFLGLWGRFYFRKFSRSFSKT